jgi:phage anti-repressor protein
MSTQLIPVVASVIGNQTVQTVDGRALHTFLEVPTEFSKWIDRRIEEYEFEEDKDFSSFLAKSTGGRPTKEYALTLDMGKELAMVERTPKGKQARQYFIECERIALHAQPQPADPAALAQQLADLLKDKIAVDRAEWTTVRQGIDALREAFGWLDRRAETIERTAVRFPAAPREPRARQRPAAPPDPWEPQVRAYVAGRQEVTSTLVLTHLGVPTAEQTQVPKNRIAKILIGLGFVGYRVKRAGSTRRIWQRHHHA